MPYTTEEVRQRRLAAIRRAIELGHVGGNEDTEWLLEDVERLEAHLRAVEAAHQQAIAQVKAELKDVTNAAEDWFTLLQESRSDRERLANESWAAERVAHAITTVELEAAEARLHALEAEPGAR